VVVQQARLRNFELERTFIVATLSFAFLSSAAQFWGILGFKSIFERWLSAYLIYGVLRFLCDQFICFVQICIFGVLFSYFRATEKRTK